MLRSALLSINRSRHRNRKRKDSGISRVQYFSPLERRAIGAEKRNACHNRMRLFFTDVDFSPTDSCRFAFRGPPHRNRKLKFGAVGRMGLMMTRSHVSQIAKSWFHLGLCSRTPWSRPRPWPGVFEVKTMPRPQNFVLEVSWRSRPVPGFIALATLFEVIARSQLQSYFINKSRAGARKPRDAACFSYAHAMTLRLLFASAYQRSRLL